MYLFRLQYNTLADLCRPQLLCVVFAALPLQCIKGVSHKPEIQISEIFLEHIKPFERKKIDCAQIHPDKDSLKEHRFGCKISDLFKSIVTTAC